MTGHDALLVDLDGTVYAGPDAIPGAVAALESARGRGASVSYVTNNAARAPGAVAAHLADLGLTVTAADVVTSAQAGAAVLAEQLASGSRVLVVGTEALADEVREVGLEPVRREADRPVAVVQGHSPETGWSDLAEAALALARDTLWVACNVDPTLPSERGFLPGNGSMVAALRHASGRSPQVAGKPAAPLLRQAAQRVGARDPLVVGDRLDTDVAGGHAVGAATLLVLTGVSTAADVLVAPPLQRPTHLAADLGALADLEAVRLDVHDGWEATVEGDVLHLTGPSEGPDEVPAGSGTAAAALRALATAWWAAGRDGVPRVRSGGDAAGDAVTALGLDRAATG